MFSRLLPLLAAAFAQAALALPVVKTEHVEARLVAERPAAAPGTPLAFVIMFFFVVHWLL